MESGSFLVITKQSFNKPIAAIINDKFEHMTEPITIEEYQLRLFSYIKYL